MPPQVITYPDPSATIQAAAEIFLRESAQAIADRGRFSVSLSGGSTPRALYELLASPHYVAQVDWSRVAFFWGDERCVPPEHNDSDYGMAKAALLDYLPAHASPQIYRLEGEIQPEVAANRYEQILRNYFGDCPEQSFDLLLLGLGEDVHTASLFPGTQPIHETTRWVAAHYVPKLAAWRLTLTPPIFNRAQTTVFLVTGNTKLPALQHLLHSPFSPDQYPAQIIQPTNDRLLILTDQTV
jgi:6-phosphogluconolactonase